MARKTYVFQTNPDGSYQQPLQMVEKHERRYPYRGEARLLDKAQHHVIGDIEPYQSTLTGETITSRSKHRKHLREHGCVEIGTESLDRAQTYFEKPKRGGDVVEDVRRAMDQH